MNEYQTAALSRFIRRIGADKMVFVETFQLIVPDAVPDMYDDGGLSGGTLERPALKRLLEDIKNSLDGAVIDEFNAALRVAIPAITETKNTRRYRENSCHREVPEPQERRKKPFLTRDEKWATMHLTARI
jgi:hypothetical protein